MSGDMEMAKCYMNCCGYSLVVVRDKVQMATHGRGVFPLLMLYDKCQEELDNASLADRVIGRAAAFIISETKVCEVYAEVMSQPAAKILSDNGINYSYGRLVPEILDKTMSGPCPIEKICGNITRPIEAIMAITADMCRTGKCFPQGTGAAGKNPECN